MGRLLAFQIKSVFSGRTVEIFNPMTYLLYPGEKQELGGRQWLSTSSRVNLLYELKMGGIVVPGPVGLPFLV